MTMLDYSNYIKTGLSKINNKWYKTIILGIMAGFFIALAGFASTIVSYTIANPSLAKLLSGCIFPIGLILMLIHSIRIYHSYFYIWIFSFLNLVLILFSILFTNIYHFRFDTCRQSF